MLLYGESKKISFRESIGHPLFILFTSTSWTFNIWLTIQSFIAIPILLKFCDVDITHCLDCFCTQLRSLCQTLYFGAPKSLQMVTAAMKLKDAYSLEGKL